MVMENFQDPKSLCMVRQGKQKAGLLPQQGIHGTATHRNHRDREVDGLIPVVVAVGDHFIPPPPVMRVEKEAEGSSEACSPQIDQRTDDGQMLRWTTLHTIIEKCSTFSSDGVEQESRR